MTITRTHRRTAHLLLALMLLLAALASNSANWAAPRVGAQEKEAPPEEAVAGTNLLRNGSFELDADGNRLPDRWMYFNFDGAQLERQSGGMSGGYHLAASNNTTTAKTFTFRQTVGGITPGASYKVNGYISIEPGSTVEWIQAYLIWKDGSGNYIHSLLLKEWRASTSGYTWFVQSRQAPAGAASLTLTMSVSKLRGNASIRWDQLGVFKTT